MMKTLICGSGGRIGSALMKSIEGAIGVDLPEHDLRIWDGAWREKFVGVDRVINAAGTAAPYHSYDKHLESVVIAMNILRACADAKVVEVVLSSSTWADRHISDGRDQTFETQAYGAAKRAVNEMAEHYPGRVKIVKVGWYTGSPASMSPDAPAWLEPLHWSTSRLIKEYIGS
jgi:nucleoside-diphosphate-sugar epimerase